MAHQRLRAVGDQGQAQVLVSLQKVVALTHASLSISSDASPWREIAVVWLLSALFWVFNIEQLCLIRFNLTSTLLCSALHPPSQQ
ncbi:hypothetical protein V6N13_035167 [Hibiscus sabdariffa]